MMPVRVAFFTLLACVALCGDAAGAVFGLIDTGELYASTDGGATWAIRATLPVDDAVGLAAGASASDLFLLSGAGSVYRSLDAGLTWSGVGALTASDVASFTINFDGSLLVLTESGTLYRSADEGGSFTAIAALTGSEFASLARGPQGRLYVLARGGEVYESQNQGTTWTAVGSVPVSNAVSLRRKGLELHLLTATGEVYRSLNQGRSWLAIGAITASNMATLIDVGSTLLAAAETGEVYGSPSGASWSAVGAINQLRVRALASDTPLATGVPVEETSPGRVVARGPFPNPATRAGSVFTFETTRPDQVRLEIYDVHGRLLAEHLSEVLVSAGRVEVAWRPEVPRGTYFVRARSASGVTLKTKWTLLE